MNDLPIIEQSSAGEIQGLPHSREAEEAVLGAVLINPEAYYEVAQIIAPDDFYIVRNRWIWESFTRLHEKRTPIDFLTVSEELEKASQMNEIGGSAYLMSLINQTPTSLHAEAYAISSSNMPFGGGCSLPPTDWRSWHTTRNSRLTISSMKPKNPSLV